MRGSVPARLLRAVCMAVAAFAALVAFGARVDAAGAPHASRLVPAIGAISSAPHARSAASPVAATVRGAARGSAVATGASPVTTSGRTSIHIGQRAAASVASSAPVAGPVAITPRSPLAGIATRTIDRTAARVTLPAAVPTHGVSSRLEHLAKHVTKLLGEGLSRAVRGVLPHPSGALRRVSSGILSIAPAVMHRSGVIVLPTREPGRRAPIAGPRGPRARTTLHRRATPSRSPASGTAVASPARPFASGLPGSRAAVADGGRSAVRNKTANRPAGRAGQQPRLSGASLPRTMRSHEPIHRGDSGHVARHGRPAAGSARSAHPGRIPRHAASVIGAPEALWSSVPALAASPGSMVQVRSLVLQPQLADAAFTASSTISMPQAALVWVRPAVPAATQAVWTVASLSAFALAGEILVPPG